ncbi:MAG: hypothetical protein ACLFUZ_05070 [Candidatus Micrarchaeia archaeon]
MKNYLIIAFLVFGLLLFGCPGGEQAPAEDTTPEEETPEENETTMPGSDRDEHGCIPSAGYEWCESLQECIRPWETECPDVNDTPMVGNDSDEHGCKGSAGYEWCESLQECIRPWETECPKTIEEIAQEFCGDENVQSVAVCGEHIRVVSSLEGGGTTLYNKTGGEITTCPVVAPDAMSETCKEYLLENNCAEQKIC